MLDKGWRSRTRRWGFQWVALGGVLLGASIQAQAADAAPAAGGSVEVKLHDVPVKVTASSVLADPKTPGRYGPANLLDEDPNTIWAEGAASTGAGEWVELSFPSGTPVYAFLVMPGNPKSAQLYQANARPKKAKLELNLAEGRQLSYDLDFPKDFPAGGAIYVEYGRDLAIESARLTVVSVWPGSKYKDLCLATFVPVFKGPDENSLKTFQGTGKELAPTLSTFMSHPRLLLDLLPTKESGQSAWLRAYPKVPFSGPLSTPQLELDIRNTNPSDWGYYSEALAEDVASVHVHSQSELFQLSPVVGEAGYEFGLFTPLKKSAASANFRTRWRRVDGAWSLVEIDMKFREETPY
jgi:hypothetical protein